MNAKKCKMIRQAIRVNGANPREARYEHALPYISSWFTMVKNPVTGLEQQVKQTAAPLKLDACGRRIYTSVKQDFADKKVYRVR